MLLSYKLVYYPKYIINCAPKRPGGCPVVAGAGWWRPLSLPAQHAQEIPGQSFSRGSPKKFDFPEFPSCIPCFTPHRPHWRLADPCTRGRRWHQIPDISPGQTSESPSLLRLVLHQDDEGIFRWTPLYTLTRCSGNIKRAFKPLSSAHRKCYLN